MDKWNMVKLSDVFTLQMGKTPSRNNPDYWNGNHKWLSIADFGMNGKYINKTKECITDAAVAESGIKATPHNTVVMSFKLSIGKTAITVEDIFTNEAIMSFIDKGTYPIDVNYIYHLFSGKDWSKGTNKAVMGTTLNKATLSQITIPLPPIEIQYQIADNLDKVSKLIDICNTILNKLDILVKSRFVEMFGDPIINPHNWSKVPLGELAEIKIGPFGSLLHKEDYINNGHALVNPSHIKEDKIIVDNSLTVSDEKYAELSAYHLHKNDVVLGRRGEMGRCAVVNDDGLLCGTGSIIIRTNGVLESDYIQKIISFPSFIKSIEDMAVGQIYKPNLNVPIVSKFLIICFSTHGLSERILFSLVEQTDKSKLAVKRILEKAETLKKSLMQEYFG